MKEDMKTIDYMTSAQKAYEILKENILNGSLRPGEKLSKRNMARLTGFSVIPVIEALNKLEADGLVESQPLWGSFVSIPSEEKIRDMHVLREAIECQVARILCECADDEQKKNLLKAATELDAIDYTQGSKDEIMDKHYDLHLMIARYTGNKILVDELKRIGLFDQLCRAVQIRRSTMPVSKHFHEDLIKGILASDPDTAQKIMREHVNDSLKYISGK